ncbi:hypothetical protein GCM10008983_27180 [Lentibacillus halophilus]|uniref:Type 4 fimbrial biogenesis protein PilX N-terminal domain-containing protein n=1 Tax=Lentibacillus halophilus TaxID=295065 RepID=A0ABN0ZIP3_9BACI
MNRLRNERGAALVLTLMMITLILLFVLTLLYQVTNTTRQITTMDENIDAHLVAEMGVDYYQTLVHERVKGQAVEKVQDIDWPETPTNYPIDDNRTFSIKIDQRDNTNKEKTEIEFTSEGKAHGRTETIEQSITITLE